MIFEKINQICVPLKISQSINIEESTFDRNKSKTFLGVRCILKKEKKNKKTEDGENLFFESLVTRFWLTS